MYDKLSIIVIIFIVLIFIFVLPVIDLQYLKQVFFSFDPLHPPISHENREQKHKVRCDGEGGIEAFSIIFSDSAYLNTPTTFTSWTHQPCAGYKKQY